jgi:hypothetical protein
MKLRDLFPLAFGMLAGLWLYNNGLPLVQQFLAHYEEPLCVVEDLDHPGGWVKIYPDSLQPCNKSGCSERLYPTDDLERFMLEMVIDIRCNGAPLDKYFEEAPDPPDADIEDFNKGQWRQETHQ